MMKLFFYFFVTSLTAFSISAYAVDCSNPPGGIDLSSAQANYQCAEKDRITANQKLNQVYKKLIGSLKDDTTRETMPRSQIMVAQRAWIAFRDAECDFRTNLNGGAPQWLIVNHSQCLTELTAQRTKILEEYLGQAQDQ